MERKCCRGNYEKHEETRCLARKGHSIGCLGCQLGWGSGGCICRSGYGFHQRHRAIRLPSPMHRIPSPGRPWLLPECRGRRRTCPAKFDLREQGVVTPVKLQNPWSSCWAFAVAAASETSILSEAKDKGIDIDTRTSLSVTSPGLPISHCPRTMTRTRAARA